MTLEEVATPHRFHLQLRSQQEALSTLMDQLDAVMEEEFLLQSTDPSLPPPAMSMYVAARWLDEMWYRAQVTGFHSPQVVRLHYIDVGSVRNVEWWKVRRLPPQFLCLPAQALRASLAGLRPRTGTWGRQAGRALMRLAGHSDPRGIIAIQTGRSRSGRLSVWLVDTVRNNLPEGVWINHALVAEGHAEFTVVKDRALEVVVKPRLCSLVREVLEAHRTVVGGGQVHRLAEIEGLISDMEALVVRPVGEVEARQEGDWRVEKMGTGRGGEEVAVVWAADQVWVACREVSLLVWEWRGYDLLETRLQAKGLEVGHLRLGEGGQGWACLLKEGLVSPGQGQVLLYRLETLPGALSVISQEAAEALMTVWQRVKLQKGTAGISVAGELAVQ